MGGTRWSNSGGEDHAHEKGNDIVSPGVPVNVLWSREPVKIVNMMIVH